MENGVENGVEIKKKSSHNLRRFTNIQTHMYVYLSKLLINMHVNPKCESREECEFCQKINMYNNLPVFS